MGYLQDFLSWYSLTVDRLLVSDIGKLKSLLVYRTPKYVIVDYWVVGLLNRTLQAAIIFYVIFSLTVDKSCKNTA